MKSYEIENLCATKKIENNSSKKNEIVPILLSLGLIVGYTFIGEWKKLVESKIR